MCYLHVALIIFFSFENTHSEMQTSPTIFFFFFPQRIVSNIQGFQLILVAGQVTSMSWKLEAVSLLLLSC